MSLRDSDTPPQRDQVFGTHTRNAGAFSKRPDIAELAGMRGWAERIRTLTCQNDPGPCSQRLKVSRPSSIVCGRPASSIPYFFRTKEIGDLIVDVSV
jgi:hypothetical protein